MKNSRLALSVTLAAVGTFCWVPGSASARPALLAVETGCELWLGTASGNDPSVRVNLRLCREGNTVTGSLQWSSLESGWNERSVVGEWNGDVLTARDTGIVREAPNPGWYFCEINPYLLTRSGDRLSGTYRAPECDDNARVELRKIESPETAPPNAVEPSPGQVPIGDERAQTDERSTREASEPPTTMGARASDQPSVPSPERVSSGGCGCHVTPGRSATSGILLVFLFSFGLLTRRQFP